MWPEHLAKTSGQAYKEAQLPKSNIYCWKQVQNTLSAVGLLICGAMHLFSVFRSQVALIANYAEYYSPNVCNIFQLPMGVPNCLLAEMGSTICMAPSSLDCTENFQRMVLRGNLWLDAQTTTAGYFWSKRAASEILTLPIRLRPYERKSKNQSKKVDKIWHKRTANSRGTGQYSWIFTSRCQTSYSLKDVVLIQFHVILRTT